MLAVSVPSPPEQLMSSLLALLPSHMPVTVAVVGASQHVAMSVPACADPLFWMLAVSVPSPPEQLMSSLLALLPSHMPVTVAVVGAPQHVAMSVPACAEPLFWMLAVS